MKGALAASSTKYSEAAAKAAKHLCLHDPVLGRIIDQAGPVAIEPHDDYFRALTGSIIGQQLSVKVAATIRQRFANLGDKSYPRPEETVAFNDEQLRGIGLSRAKLVYIRDLAQHITDKRIDLRTLPSLPNEEIIAELTDVKGIGEWTAHMFLMFCLGRLDVLPTGDLGIKKGMQSLYELPELPTPIEMMTIAEHNRWTGYESIASWYVWRSIDMAVVI